MNGKLENQISGILLILHEYRGTARSILRKYGIEEDVEDALSDTIEKIAIKLHSGYLSLDKPKEEYLKLFTAWSKNRLLDINKRGIGKQRKKETGDSPPTVEPIDLRHRASNRLRASKIDELVSDQDVFEDVTRKNAIHVSQTLVDDVLNASSEAANKVTRKYYEMILATKQDTVSKADLARECGMTRSNISITLSKVRKDVTKRRPDILETYVDFFAV